MNAQILATEIKQQILSKLDSNSKIKITDETHKHIKHKGYINGKYHFLLEIESDKLNKLKKIASHKEIYKVVSPQMDYIHALSIKIK